MGILSNIDGTSGLSGGSHRARLYALATNAMQLPVTFVKGLHSRVLFPAVAAVITLTLPDFGDCLAQQAVQRAESCRITSTATPVRLAGWIRNRSRGRWRLAIRRPAGTLRPAHVEAETVRRDPVSLGFHEEPLAFPGAVGFGRNATGGQGGEVYYVTNLQASGPGSLYEGIASSRPEVPRTIAFAVSGTAETQSAVFTGKANLTLAGETAPGAGFCWRGDLRFDGAKNLVIRNLRFRCDPLPDVVKWCLFFDGSEHEVSKIIVDHCTFSWSTDEMLAFHRAEGITVQYCLLHEWCRCFVASDAAGKSAMFFDDCRGVTIYRNVMAHTPWRAPLVSGEKFQVYENVVYNQRDMAGMVLAGAPGRNQADTQVELVSNLRLTGPAAEIAFPSGGKLQWLQIANAYDYGSGVNWIHARGNVADPERGNDKLDLVAARLDGDFDARPVPWTGHDPSWPLLVASDVNEAWLSDRLSSCGPVQGLDAAEQRIVDDIMGRSEARAGTVRYLSQDGFSDYYPLNPAAVGGYPQLEVHR